MRLYIDKQTGRGIVLATVAAVLFTFVAPPMIAPVKANPFSDIAEDHWSYQAVRKLKAAIGGHVT